jgi:hypothetical protein
VCEDNTFALVKTTSFFGPYHRFKLLTSLCELFFLELATSVSLEDMMTLIPGVSILLCRESRRWNELWCMLIPTYYTRRHRFSIVGTDSVVDIVRIGNSDAVAR